MITLMYALFVYMYINIYTSMHLFKLKQSGIKLLFFNFSSWITCSSLVCEQLLDVTRITEPCLSGLESQLSH